MNTHHPINESDIAIIGMSCRFPGAEDYDTFWQNLRDGVESISFFSDEELLAAGVDPALVSDPDYVKAGAILPDIDQFDASFFAYSPREAALMDPQHRLFLEEAWKALEDAGYDPSAFDGSIGVFAGGSMSSYLLNNLVPDRKLLQSVNGYQVMIGNDKDFLPTRTSYKLNLKGPSVNVQTACSTSLVAVHMACQSLLNGESDMALAGGATVQVPQKEGYLYQQGMILSPDGHCRAFDARAEGTISGSGVGIVVLKWLKDALADGDYVHAVIKGSAINNDGSLKVGYTAPSIDGQAEVISEAHAVADVWPDTITYIEAHGTATTLGDPIEIAALTQAFRAKSEQKARCAIGSVKTNVGHLDAAAGVAGLIKSALALKHKMLPPSLHFETPNPKIEFANTPFYVNHKLTDWKRDGTPRRAGVSSFGIGGTNAHLIMEEAPSRDPSGGSRAWQLLLLSAKTESALDRASANLATYLTRMKTSPQSDQTPLLALGGAKGRLNLMKTPPLVLGGAGGGLADVAYTLSTGRQAFDHRRMIVCQDASEAVKALTSADQPSLKGVQGVGERRVVLMFSGQGAQYVNMGRDLYEEEPTFRQIVDQCAEWLNPHLGLDLRHLLYPSTERTAEAAEQLKQTAYTQPALFVIEYALAQLWRSWGIRPQAMIGHSIGEYVAACLAGVFSLEDALTVVAARGKLMQQLPAGSMLAVSLPEEQLRPLLGAKEQVEVAVVNGPSLCVVSGPTEAIEALQPKLRTERVACRPLHTSHAFHSQMMEPILGSFRELVKETLAGRTPKLEIPYISNVTGTWITLEEASDPSYWANHLRQTVRFADGMQKLLTDPTRILLEVGPGRTLAALTKRHPDKTKEQVVLSSLCHPQDKQSDMAFLLNTLGKLWQAGVKIDWRAFYADQTRHRLPLPTYSFDKQRCWIDPPQNAHHQTSPLLLGGSVRGHRTDKNPNISEWFYVPSWKRLSVTAGDPSQLSCTLLFIDECGIGQQLAKELTQNGHDVMTVQIGTRFTRRHDGMYALDPGQPEDYDALLNELRELNKTPQTIVHLFGITNHHGQTDQSEQKGPLFSSILEASASSSRATQKVEKAQDLGFNSLLFLAQAIDKYHLANQLQIAVITNNLQKVTGKETLQPEKATVLGLCKVIPQEYPNMICRSIDIVLPDGSQQEQTLIEHLLTELTTKSSDPVVAYRQDERWVQTFEHVRLENQAEAKARLREGGVYLITGGLGEIGLVLAEHLAKTAQAKLVLTGRSPFPPRHEWETWLVTHDKENDASRKIERLQAIEALGGEVLVASADVADERQMQLVVALAEARFGPLNGVIHGAGVVGKEAIRPIQETNQSECKKQFHPKVHGLLVLDNVLQGQQLDFGLLLSSLSSVLGGLGFTAYSAANLFMDAFAESKNGQSNVPWISVNWDGWQFEPQALQNGTLGASLAELAITPQEGTQAFERILSLPQIWKQARRHQIIVSTGDLQNRIDKWVKVRPFKPIKQIQAIKHTNGPLALSQQTVVEPLATTDDQLEQTLIDLWQSLLGVNPVGLHDNFFELGGHSLLAVQLFAELEPIAGQKLPLATLFNAPTIAELAELVQKVLKQRKKKSERAGLLPKKGSKEDSPSLVIIQAGQKKSNLPFFCASGGGGNVLNFAHLARHLGEGQPFYGLQAPGLDKTRAPYERVEDIAVHYLREIRIIQPNGPYFLGGMCFGALVALEMAQQLHKQGERADLFVIDTLAPDDGFLPLIYLRLFKYHIQHKQVNYIYRTIKEKLNNTIKGPPENPFEHLVEPHTKAQNHYTIQPYAGKITLFKNQFNSLRGDERELYHAWFEVTGGKLERYIVPGCHATILEEPYVRQLAKALRACLDKAQP